VSLTQHHGGWVITLSFLLALALSIVPLPGLMEMLRPEWVTLVLIYWCMALPNRVSVGIGWLLGLVLDVLRDTLIGQYALALALVAFLTLHLHQRIRVFPLWQQALSIFVLTMLQNLIVLWIKGLTGHSPDFWSILPSAFTTMLVWPLIYLLLRQVRRAYHVV
jgi:rod shape-determining protein MreD